MRPGAPPAVPPITGRGRCGAARAGRTLAPEFARAGATAPADATGLEAVATPWAEAAGAPPVAGVPPAAGAAVGWDAGFAPGAGVAPAAGGARVAGRSATPAAGGATT